MDASIIIIGAGAAGLCAGRRLSEAGYRVLLLEAAAEAGGRILPLTPEGFHSPVEGGAEFIHGELPLSLGLMKEAGVELQPVKAKMVRWRSGKGWADASGEEGEGGVMGADWGALMEAMAGLTADLPVAAFLETYFAGERYTGLRESVKGFAEGYDLADLDRASTLALYREWSGEEGQEEYRPIGGYRPMIDFLVAECRRTGAVLYCSTPVTGVRWQKGRVTVQVRDGRSFEADKLVVSVSLGVLEAGGLPFDPAIPELERAVKALGFGSVIKILLTFKELFWRERKPRDQTLFVLSDQPVPTWWTPADDDSPVLTGWLAGERMRRFQLLDEAGRLDSCLRSLAAIFSRDIAWLRETLAGVVMPDWAAAPFVRGGYSFETVGAAAARGLVSQGIAGTIFFCGEAFYAKNEAPGTVEAALQSGWDVAEMIIAQS